MADRPSFRYACASCGVGLTDALAYDRDGRRLCPHCYGAPAGRRGVFPDPGHPGG